MDRQRDQYSGRDVADVRVLRPFLPLAQVDRHEGHELADPAYAVRGVPFADGPRHDREHHVDHRSAEPLLDFAHLGEGQVQPGETPRPAAAAAVSGCRSAWCRSGIGRSRRRGRIAGMLDGVDERAGDGGRGATPRSMRSRRASANRRVSGEARARIPLNDATRAVPGPAGLALPVGHGGEDGIAADAVGHGVMQLEEQAPRASPRMPSKRRASQSGRVRSKGVS